MAILWLICISLLAARATLSQSTYAPPTTPYAAQETSHGAHDSQSCQKSAAAVRDSEVTSPEEASAIQEMKRKHPFMANRFSDNQLAKMERKKKVWNDMKSKPEQMTTFTPDQAAFIHKVRTCRGKGCFDEHGNEP